MDAFLLAGQSNMVLIHNLLEAALKDAYGSDTVVIKAAVGSTSILQWQPGQTLYNETLTACQSAMQAGAVFRGVLWSQGEADTISTAVASAWKQKYYSFLSIRTALGNPVMPAVHSVLGFKPATGTPRPNWDVVVQQQILAQKMPNLALIGMSDFEHTVDDLHVAPVDRQAFALRFCDAIKRLAP